MIKSFPLDCSCDSWKEPSVPRENLKQVMIGLDNENKKEGMKDKHSSCSGGWNNDYGIDKNRMVSKQRWWLKYNQYIQEN